MATTVAAASANGVFDGVGVPALVAAVEQQNLSNPDFRLGRSPRVGVRTNVNYIAAAIMLRSVDGKLQLCLVEEARTDAYGKWYLPAGRVEPGESLEDACKREVLEESGLEVTVNDLISVEVQGGGWYRFAFSCSVVGGSLKTEADKESLSAKWFSVAEVLDRKVVHISLPFRANDMLGVIRDAVALHEHAQTARVRPKIAVVAENISGMFLRLLIVRRKQNRMEVLMSRDTAGVGHDSLPVVEFALNNFVAAVVSKFYRELLVDGTSSVAIPSRCIGVQCLPSPNQGAAHGLCLTLLCVEKPRMDAQPSRPQRYYWAALEQPALVEMLELQESAGPVFHML